MAERVIQRNQMAEVDGARRLLREAVEHRYDSQKWWHEARALLAQPEPAVQEAVLVEALRFWLGVAGDSPLVARYPNEWTEHKALVADTSPAAAATSKL